MSQVMNTLDDRGIITEENTIIEPYAYTIDESFLSHYSTPIINYSSNTQDVWGNELNSSPKLNPTLMDIYINDLNNNNLNWNYVNHPLIPNENQMVLNEREFLNFYHYNSSLAYPVNMCNNTNVKLDIKEEANVKSGKGRKACNKGSKKKKNDGKYECGFVGCGKKFTRPYNLKAHFRIHTKERPFNCSTCNLSFSRLHDMKRHANLHTGIKPFLCPACNKGFARLDALNRHYKKDLLTCATVSRSKKKNL